MITIDKEPVVKIEEIGSLADYLSKTPTLKRKVAKAIEVVKAMPINGCITGSCWLPGFDPDAWGSTPDIDIFVYSEKDLIRAITIAEHTLKMKPGKGSDRTEQQERWKIDRLFKSGLSYKIGITTYTFYADGIMLNFTFKQSKIQGRWIPLVNAASVLMSFDMSIVMQAYDIKSRVMFDLRPSDVPVNVAIPNPLRDHDCVMWTVAKWVRQFDRVVKYYNRGYDTRPMAQFYLDMIDQCIEAGCLFDSEESNDAFLTFAKEFTDKRTAIADWLDEHKED